MFHTDAVLCAVSSISLGTSTPIVLRQEAPQYRPAGNGRDGVLGSSKYPATRPGVPVFGSTTDVMVEKAILANCCAVREWDSNGTNFGYSAERSHHRAGEFGHND